MPAHICHKGSVGYKLYPFQSVSVKRKPSVVSFRLVSMKQSSVSFICLYKPLCLYVGYVGGYKPVIFVNKICIKTIRASRHESCVKNHSIYHAMYIPTWRTNPARYDANS